MDFIYLMDLQQNEQGETIAAGIHYMPMHPEHGLGKTEAQLKKEGVLIEKAKWQEPEPQKGMAPYYVCDVKKQTVEVRYKEIPPTPEEQTQAQMQQIQAQNMALMAALADMYEMML